MLLEIVDFPDSAFNELHSKQVFAIYPVSPPLPTAFVLLSFELLFVTVLLLVESWLFPLELCWGLAVVGLERLDNRFEDCPEFLEWTVKFWKASNAKGNEHEPRQLVLKSGLSPNREDEIRPAQELRCAKWKIIEPAAGRPSDLPDSSGFDSEMLILY